MLRWSRTSHPRNHACSGHAPRAESGRSGQTRESVMEERSKWCVYFVDLCGLFEALYFQKNIKSWLFSPGFSHNFNKADKNTTYTYDYDYASIMHYGSKYFRYATSKVDSPARSLACRCLSLSLVQEASGHYSRRKKGWWSDNGWIWARPTAWSWMIFTAAFSKTTSNGRSTRLFVLLWDFENNIYTVLSFSWGLP